MKDSGCSGGSLLSVEMDQVLRHAAFYLLRFRQHRDPIATAEFSSVLVDLEGACDAEHPQQETGIEKSKIRSSYKTQQQEQYPNK
jgi:hypothetical protein